MNFIMEIIKKNLEQREPALNLQEADRKMLQLAYQDFINYSKFTLNSGSQEMCSYQVTSNIEQYYKDNRTEAEEFFDVWTGLWLKKWKTRVKLILSDLVSNQVPKDCSAGGSSVAGLNEVGCRKDLVEMVTSVLVRCGEICGAEVLANELLRREVSCRPNLDLANGEQLFAVLNGAMRRARDMANTVGPFIFVKVDKEYFAEVKSSH
jgi:hypothetical protein